MGIHVFFGMGIFPLAFFAFSLVRPSPATRKALILLAVAAPLLLLIAIGAGRRGFFLGAEGFVRLLAFALPALVAAAMAVSGAGALVRRCPPGIGIPLSLLNAAGCPGLVAGAWLAVFLRFAREAGVGGALPVILAAGGVVALAVAAHSLALWRRRLSPGEGRPG